MKDSKLLMNAILTILPNKSENKFSKSTEIINNLLSRYFIGLVLQITILFVLYTITLLIFGINNAVVIAFLCALLNLIPYIGPIIGAVIMFLLSMTSNLGQDFQTEILPTTMYVMIGYLIAQIIDNFFSQPFIFSKTTKSHPLEIFLIIIIGGLLFGVVGMITAVPLYTALKVILKEFSNLFLIICIQIFLNCYLKEALLILFLLKNWQHKSFLNKKARKNYQLGSKQKTSIIQQKLI